MKRIDDMPVAQNPTPAPEPAKPAKPAAAAPRSRPATPVDAAPARLVSDATARKIDDTVTAWAGRMTGGLPAPRIVQAYIDWAMCLAASPGRQLQLLECAVRGQLDLLASMGGEGPAVNDPRFSGPTWSLPPFSLFARAALQREALMKLATEPLPGMGRHNAELVRFYSQQWMDAFSPANHPLTNPEFLRTTIDERGLNLVRGARNALEDGWKRLRRKPEAPSAKFRVGQTLATTPGKVVYRNELMELIQYAPTTGTVYAEPILILPAWIMKYYILDLSAHNSLVRWLVAQGHTVFMVSWKNPGAADRDRGMEDYLNLGLRAALDTVCTIVPGQKVHATGYCVGGTLLSIGAAALARENDQRLASVTLFAAQTDFADAGELGLFIDEMSLYWLDQQMRQRGFLESGQMGGAFSLLRSRDLIWGPKLRRYCFGERSDSFDIMAWNADGTRMPARMHSDYLRQLYLENQLAQGKYRIGGQHVSLGDVRLPLFVVGTTTDHVAPWKSVYKIRNLKRLGDTTFVLTNGGHNAGIVSEPGGKARRHFRMGRWDQDTSYQSPDEWAASANANEGSWWPAWQQWLAGRSGDKVAPPAIGKAGSSLGDAPGTYVFER